MSVGSSVWGQPEIKRPNDQSLEYILNFFSLTAINWGNIVPFNLIAQAFGPLELFVTLIVVSSH